MADAKIGATYSAKSFSTLEVIEVPQEISEEFVGLLEKISSSESRLILRFPDASSDRSFAAFHSAKVHAHRLRTALRRLELRQVPIVGAAEGSLSGIHLELALACHARFVLHEESQVGFPFAHLGSIPILGSTQRLPWLVGADLALRLLLFEEILATQAFVEKRLEVIAQSNLMDAAQTWMELNPKPRQPWDAGIRPEFHSQDVLERYRLQKSYLRLRDKFPPEDEVYTALLRCFHDGWERTFEAGLLIEKQEAERLSSSRGAQNRERIFHVLRQQALAQVPSDQKKLHCLAVLGGGLMGTGIACAAARAGCAVRLFDVSAAALDRAHERILKMPNGQTLRNQVQLLDRLEGIADADFVVEAVFERAEIKKPLLQRASELVEYDAVLASNTTTLPISSLAEACRRPERFIGTHFFSPVERMELLEIIMGSKTHEDTLDRALALAGTLGKIPIVVRDGPGFYTSRVVMAYAQEAFFLLEEGVSPWLVDNVARNAGMPIGPLAMADILSLDLLLDVARSLAHYGLGAAKVAHRTVSILSRLVQQNRLGRKSGGGIYEYRDGRNAGAWPDLNSLFPAKSNLPDAATIDQRLFVIQTLETLHALKEGILEQPEPADLASVLGWGYPAFKGGPMGFIDYVGGDQFARIRASLENEYGERFFVP
jgi:3-hydroxyacyl-CoA dehydrogenase/enoyl-CoA hydratase/3-hydroxybutyryl-CoA epimerase